MSLLKKRETVANRIKKSTDYEEAAILRAKKRKKQARALETEIMQERRKLLGLAWDTVELNDGERLACSNVLKKLPEDKRGPNWDVVSEFLIDDDRAGLGDEPLDFSLTKAKAENTERLEDAAE